MGSEKLTVPQRHALEWVGEKAIRPWVRGRKGYPKMVSLEILVRAGLVDRVSAFRYDLFNLSPAGRSALSTTTKGEGDA